MSFHSFMNPFRDGGSVPEIYRTHHHLQRLFQADDTYYRPAKDPITLWIIDILRREYHVPLHTVALEVSPELTQSESSSEKADIVVYDDRFINAAEDFYVAFILVEVSLPRFRRVSRGSS